MMEKKRSGWKTVLGIFVVIWLCAGLCEIITGKSIITRIPDSVHLFIWYGLVSYICYHSIWGDLAERSYNSAKKIKLLGYDKMPFEKYKESWKRFSIFFFITCTVAFIIGLFNVFN